LIVLHLSNAEGERFVLIPLAQSEPFCTRDGDRPGGVASRLSQHARIIGRSMALLKGQFIRKEDRLAMDQAIADGWPTLAAPFQSARARFHYI
jgi:hypothetical protein